MKLCVIGTGYIGLVGAAIFAEWGHEVMGVDIDAAKIAKIKSGEMPIFEPGLKEVVLKNIAEKRLDFTTDLSQGMKDAEVVFIAVGTPPDEDGSADLKYVLGVASSIGEHMTHPLVVVTKSTVPVTTAEKVRKAVQTALDKRGVKMDFYVASNPEFLKEGAAIEDFMKPDRIVVGTDRPEAEEIMKKLYKPFLMNGHPIIFMDIPSAEMTKYAANAMLATKISFMNDVANLCEIMGADVNMVRKGIGSDTRIGTKFIYPGVGYGGSCFPKDVKALIKTAKENGYDMRILNSVENVNEAQKEVLFNKVKKHFKGDLKGKKFALWGLSFKPKTDDMREAPSLVIIDKLLNEGASVVAYDPVAMHEAQRILGNKISYTEELNDSLNGADALLIITEWPEFRVPDFDELGKRLKAKVMFDGRNIFDPAEMKKMGYSYYCIGVNTN